MSVYYHVASCPCSVDTRLGQCILELHGAEVVEGRADTRVPLSSSVREFIDAHESVP